MRHARHSIAFATLLAAAGAAGAQDALPEPRHENGVAWLCGGIGETEAAAMKRAARGYDLALTFARRDGAYLADAQVTIADAKGRTVLDTRCDAPMLLVDLPRDGSYRVRASIEGREQTRSVQVGGGTRAIALLWPDTTGRGAAPVAGGRGERRS